MSEDNYQEIKALPPEEKAKVFRSINTSEAQIELMAPTFDKGRPSTWLWQAPRSVLAELQGAVHKVDILTGSRDFTRIRKIGGETPKAIGIQKNILYNFDRIRAGIEPGNQNQEALDILKQIALGNGAYGLVAVHGNTDSNGNFNVYFEKAEVGSDGKEIIKDYKSTAGELIMDLLPLAKEKGWQAIVLTGCNPNGGALELENLDIPIIAPITTNRANGVEVRIYGPKNLPPRV